MLICLNYKDEIIKRFLFKETVSVTFYLKNGLINKIGSLHDAEQYYKYNKLLIIRSVVAKLVLIYKKKEDRKSL